MTAESRPDRLRCRCRDTATRAVTRRRWRNSHARVTPPRARVWRHVMCRFPRKIAHFSTEKRCLPAPSARKVIETLGAHATFQNGARLTNREVTDAIITTVDPQRVPMPPHDGLRRAEPGSVHALQLNLDPRDRGGGLRGWRRRNLETADGADLHARRDDRGDLLGRRRRRLRRLHRLPRHRVRRPAVRRRPDLQRRRVPRALRRPASPASPICRRSRTSVSPPAVTPRSSTSSRWPARATIASTRDPDPADWLIGANGEVGVQERHLPLRRRSRVPAPARPTGANLFDCSITGCDNTRHGYVRTEAESILGYVYLTPAADRVPVYRVANPNGGGGFRTPTGSCRSTARPTAPST